MSIIRERETGTTVERPETPIRIIREGITGPPGPAGPQGMEGPQGDPGAPGVGSAYHRHVQGTPEAVWTVTHGLGFRPSVTVVDSTQRVVLPGRVEHVNDNTVVLSFFGSNGPVAFAGEAYFS